MECWGSCPALLLVMLLRTQLPFGHWLFIVGYNVTFDRPPRRQRMPTCADNGHRAFKSADPAHRRLLLLLVFFYSHLIRSSLLSRRSLRPWHGPNGIFRWDSNASAPRPLKPKIGPRENVTKHTRSASRNMSSGHTFPNRPSPRVNQNKSPIPAHLAAQTNLGYTRHKPEINCSLHLSQP